MSIDSTQIIPQSNHILSSLTNKAKFKGSLLEQLPSIILDSIFYHLGKYDLLNVCFVSRNLHFPAISRLFRNISIIDDAFVAARIEYQMRKFSTHDCTIITSAKVRKLLLVIQNNNFLASLIQSLNIVKAMDVALIPSLLRYTHLESFHYRGHLNIPPEATANLQSMTCFISVSFTYLPQLLELKLLYSEEDESHAKYQKLALSLIESNSYHKLKRLVFEYADRIISREFTDDSKLPQASWTAFFDAFARRSIKLNLISLGLDGNLRNAGGDTAQLIRSVVSLGDLVSLELNYFENSHPKEKHEDHKITFLEAISKDLPSLQYLYINHTGNCRLCHINSLTKTLQENIPHQLKQLVITFMPPKTINSDWVRRTILMNQRNLLKLKFEDNSNSWYDLKSILKELDFSQFLRWSRYSDEGRSSYLFHTLEFGITRPFLTESKIELMTLCKSSILNYLNNDLIYKNASEKLPFLTEYCILGFHIDMKSRGIFANEKTITFE